MTEIELNAEETAIVYKQVCDLKLKPFDVQTEEDFTEIYYHLNGKQYRLIYDRSGDYFCDIIYVGNYV